MEDELGPVVVSFHTWEGHLARADRWAGQVTLPMNLTEGQIPWEAPSPPKVVLPSGREVKVLQEHPQVVLSSC